MTMSALVVPQVLNKSRPEEIVRLMSVRWWSKIAGIGLFLGKTSPEEEHPLISKKIIDVITLQFNQIIPYIKLCFPYNIQIYKSYIVIIIIFICFLIYFI